MRGPTLACLAIAVATTGACAHADRRGAAALALRPACTADQRWDGQACVARAGAAAVDAAVAALAGFDADGALAALDRAAPPLDHARHVRLWEQRGIAHGYLEHAEQASAAFERLLLLAPEHRLSCEISPKATGPFERARAAAAARPVPAIELSWPRDLEVGAPIPVEVDTVADPAGQLARATIYVRTRGETAWRAADLELAPPGGYRRVRLPGVGGTRPTAVELYATGSDAQGNEVVLWASPARPRELPLRYQPDAPWYRTWWVWAIAGGVAATATGVIVYATVWEPSDNLDGTITR